MSRWDVFVWVLAPGAVLIAGSATAVLALKRRWVWTGVGGLATAAAITVMVGSWTANSESFEDLGYAAMYLLVVAPLTAVSAVAAWLPARPESWWVRRASGDGVV